MNFSEKKFLKKLRRKRHNENKNRKYSPLYIGSTYTHRSKKDYNRQEYKDKERWD